MPFKAASCVSTVCTGGSWEPARRLLEGFRRTFGDDAGERAWFGTTAAMTPAEREVQVNY